MLTPRPYQLAGRDFLAGKRIGLLADEMRVGKTGQAVLAAREVKAEESLVICPAIAVPMWKFQWQQWWPSPRPSVYSYESALLRKAELLDQQWDVVIADEAHFAGNPEAQRTRLIYGKEGLAWRCKHLWALSGTPAPKHAGSLWPLLRAAGVVKCDYGVFVNTYCRVGFDGNIVGTREERIPELRALWQQIGLRRTRKEVAPEMPDLEFDFLQMDPVKGVDLRPFSGGPLGNREQSDDELLATLELNANVNREDRVQVALAKVGPLLEEVEFALGNGLLKQTVIFGWHLDALRKLVSCLRAMGFKAELLAGETSQAKRVQIQEMFSIGLIDVVVGQIRACGTAIDLSAASHAYFLELDWVPGNNLQAANRLIAIGKDEKVTADVCTWPGSVDDRVQKVLLRRARELSKLF